MSDDNEIQNLISDIQKYLKQQSELYGEELYRSVESTPKEATAPLTPQKDLKDEMKEDTDLFGNVIPVVKSTKAVRTFSDPLQDIKGQWTNARSIDELNSMICDCQKCSLGSTRTNFVYGVGNPETDIVMIGEAPGADEDAQGEPFVGRAGQLLNKILEAIKLKREEVYICNILKCRPPNNRDPEPAEMKTCLPYLLKQLQLIKPKIILSLGRIAAQELLNTKETLASLRERVHDFHGTPFMVTFHPAALLRNPNWKRPAWEDMQKFRKLYDELKEK